MSNNKSNTSPHKPVLLDEVITYLQPKNNEIYVDCTFGAGWKDSASTVTIYSGFPNTCTERDRRFI